MNELNAPEKKYISVRVIPKAKHNAVQQLSALEFKIWVTAAPDHGKANAQVLKLLAQELGVAATRLQIIRGVTSKTKLISIQ